MASCLTFISTRVALFFFYRFIISSWPSMQPPLFRSIVKLLHGGLSRQMCLGKWGCRPVSSKFRWIQSIMWAYIMHIIKSTIKKVMIKTAWLKARLITVGLFNCLTSLTDEDKVTSDQTVDHNYKMYFPPYLWCNQTCLIHMPSRPMIINRWIVEQAPIYA